MTSFCECCNRLYTIKDIMERWCCWYCSDENKTNWKCKEKYHRDYTRPVECCGCQDSEIQCLVSCSMTLPEEYKIRYCARPPLPRTKTEEEKLKQQEQELSRLRFCDCIFAQSKEICSKNPIIHCPCCKKKYDEKDDFDYLFCSFCDGSKKTCTFSHLQPEMAIYKYQPSAKVN